MKKIAHSLIFKKPDILNFIFWLYETTTVNEIEQTNIISDSTLLGSIELNGINIGSNIKISKKGIYQLALRVDKRILENSIGVLKFFIGSYTLILEDPKINYLKNKDAYKSFGDYDVVEVKEQFSLTKWKIDLST